MRFLHQTRSLELAALVDRWKHDYSRSVVEIDPVYSRSILLMSNAASRSEDCAI